MTLIQWLVLVLSEVIMVEEEIKTVAEYLEDREGMLSSSPSMPSPPHWPRYKRMKYEEDRRQWEAARKAKDATGQRQRRVEKKREHQQMQEKLVTSR